MDVRGWDTGHHPGVALTEKREQFARLIGQGVSNSEACRVVGSTARLGHGGGSGGPSPTPLVSRCTIRP